MKTRVEPTGVLVAVQCGALALVAVFAFGIELAEISPWLAIFLLAVIIGGSTPTLWSRRRTPVLRWVIYGVAAGTAFACLGLLASIW